jgi:pimeloyl-ACP methyl ester carboxylesterase
VDQQRFAALQSLREAVTQYGGSARFIRVAWSGHNLGRDRIQAAKIIAREVEKAQAANREERVFLIGHSHGGSAIAYLLTNFPHLRDAVSGCAFLSTPFIAIRIRPLWPALVTALVAACGVIAFFLSAALGGLVLWWKLSDVESALFQALLGFTGCIVIGVTVAVLLWVKATPWMMQLVNHRVLRQIAKNETANLPPGRYLFMRASGDEAAALLGTSQLIAEFMAKVTGFATTLVMWVRSALLWLYRSSTGRFALLLFLTLFTIWLSICVTFLLSELITWREYSRINPVPPWDLGGILGRDWDIETGVVALDTAFTYSMNILWPLFVVIVSGVLLYSIVLVLAVAIGSLTVRMFGWMDVLEAIFADFSVEPVPYGQSVFTHIDWKQQGVDASGLNHSRTYQNPHALECLSVWVSKCMKPGSTVDRVG